MRSTLSLALLAIILTGWGCKASKPLPTTDAPQAPSETVNEKPPTIPNPTSIDPNAKATIVNNPTGSDLSDPQVYPEAAKTVRPRAEGVICDAENFICINSAYVYQSVGEGVSVTGTGIAFENTIQWRLMAGNTSLQKGFVTADAPDVGLPGTFTIAIANKDISNEKMVLEIYESSAKDGSDIHVLRVPLRK